MVLLSVVLVMMGMAAWLLADYDLKKHGYNFAYKPSRWFVLYCLIFVVCLTSGITLFLLTLINTVG